jgi:hypothetical protein
LRYASTSACADGILALHAPVVAAAEQPAGGIEPRAADVETTGPDAFRFTNMLTVAQPRAVRRRSVQVRLHHR